MKCDKCEASIKADEERDYYGKTLCEDCYMDALSPVRTCDPWAVHSAKTLGEKGSGLQVNAIQSKILDILLETGGVEPGALAKMLNIKSLELETRNSGSETYGESARGTQGWKKICNTLVRKPLFFPENNPHNNDAGQAGPPLAGPPQSRFHKNVHLAGDQNREHWPQTPASTLLLHTAPGSTSRTRSDSAFIMRPNVLVNL